MYSEDIYATHSADHSVLITYCAVFAILVIGSLVKMAFHRDDREYVHID
jgi:hypothetical protein